MDQAVVEFEVVCESLTTREIQYGRVSRLMQREANIVGGLVHRAIACSHMRICTHARLEAGRDSCACIPSILEVACSSCSSPIRQCSQATTNAEPT